MVLPPEETLRTTLLDKIDEYDVGRVDIAKELNIDSATVTRNLNGDVNTSYSRFQEISQYIRKHENARQKPAKDVMIGDIVWAYEGEERDEIVEKMQENQFSQLPVESEGTAIGWVTDFSLMENPESTTQVSKMIQRSMISVEPQDSVSLIKAILEEGYPAVLVKQDSEYLGIITRFDLL
jgi:predicted transcriptional regulator